MPSTRRASGLTGRPAFLSWASVPLCVVAGHALPLGAPSTTPTWYAQKCSGRWAVTFGSFWRSAPAAELPRVDEEALARVGLALVHRLELGHRHVDLAPDLQQVGVGTAGLGQLLGHVVDRGHVRRHVLPRHPVAPRGRLDEPAALVGERHGDAVDLGLAREGERVEVEARIGPAQPLPPGPQLVLVEHVVEAHHRDAVPDLLEEPRRRRAHGVRGRVRCGERRVLRLELAQLDDEEVVLGVGDLGRVEHVVQLVGAADRARSSATRAPPPAAGLALTSGHAQAAMPAPTTASGSTGRRGRSSGRAPPVAAGRRSAAPGRPPRRCLRLRQRPPTCTGPAGRARSPALPPAPARGRSTQVSDEPASGTVERSTSAALPTVTRRAATSTTVT